MMSNVSSWHKASVCAARTCPEFGEQHLRVYESERKLEGTEPGFKQILRATHEEPRSHEEGRIRFDDAHRHPGRSTGKDIQPVLHDQASR